MTPKFNMKIKQTHKTAAICGAFIAIWMISGSLVEEENFKKNSSSLDTLSSVTIINSKATDQSQILKSSGRFKNVYLIVKPHPGENEDETKSFSSNNPNIKFIPRAEDIRPFIKLCDAFVSFGSTAAMDAIILDKLVICPAFSGWNWNNAYISSKAVHSPITAKEIKHIFEVISKFNHSYLINKISKQREKLLKNWTYRNDGLAAQRIGNLALDIIQNKDQFMKPKAS